MVDEHTKKPYGPGVGDWRKELMLMSKGLDPAIGNINRHPEGAVAQIAEWIKHTWDYSEPIRFETVKEVVARGVSLRRAALWQKIRNGKPKPSLVLDESWQKLKRQMDSPAMQRKSESCRKANASRVNFGRTGPSREVDVRERLRRKFRRSPHPEEIQFEMARDKGYGGRGQKNKKIPKVLEDNDTNAELNVQVPRIAAGSSSSYGTKNTELKSDGYEKEEVNIVNVDMNSGKQSVQRVVDGGVVGVSVEEIVKHPLVMKLMERLEALEGRQVAAAQNCSVAAFEKIGPDEPVEEVTEASRPRKCNEVEVHIEELHISKTQLLHSTI